MVRNDPSARISFNRTVVGVKKPTGLEIIEPGSRRPG